ncbi:hypothetical protein [Streptomyces justiciae]|uniref:hypothetical protein n=1 Tax=Streptomyces justiciae TaxID=2780140 RepID=UPI0021179209|nr:hypothetical protein [Streptomyces justiciae]MCW8383953.1 hypothetical protein [Streptomyces justiciae]
MTPRAEPLGLMHRSHQWLGRKVTDTASGRVGILRAIAPDESGRMRAWLAPVGGGREWTTAPGALAHPERITPDTHAEDEEQ